MEIATLVGILDQPHLAAEHLQGWGLADVDRGRETLVRLADCGLTLDLLANLGGQLGRELPRLPDPDAALAALGDYMQALRSPLSLAALCERDPSALAMLLAALSLAPHWTDLLVADPEAFDLLRETGGQPVRRGQLVGQIQAEVGAFSDERSVVAALARIQSRHLLRIVYGEVIGRHTLELVQQQLSQLAEALLESALLAAERRVLESRTGTPAPTPLQAQGCLIALGRLGAGEISYAESIDLHFVYSASGDAAYSASGDAAAFRAAQEHFERTSKLLVRLFNEAQAGERAWRLRLVALPDSHTAAVAHAADDVMTGYVGFGRTWHRQALLKARCIAGNGELGASILHKLEPWLFRRYLARADETGIQALKRRIVIEATLHQDDWRDVLLARGGLRDLEATIEFLQLLAGGDQPAVRQRGSLAAIAGLEQGGTISPEERHVLEDAVAKLRAVEHRLQIFVGPETTAIPDAENGFERILAPLFPGTPPGELASQWRARLEQYWQTYRRLLDAAFEQEGPTPREVELLLDPAPPAEEIRGGLAPFGFAQPQQALANLHHLAEEQVAFLSTRRCRHLLAGILPQLLREVAASPNPDQTLDHVVRVSDSLGGKGVLWELFRASPPTLQLYVKLCAASPYLSDILTTNPGMLDELIDSLQLDKLPARAELTATLAELCRGAADTLPVLHDFKNAQHLRIGVRDILGKEDIDNSHAALADVAETCLAHVAALEYARLADKFGAPALGPGSFEGEPCRYTILGLGKLGSREPNYHSNLDLLLLYEGEGTTRAVSRGKRTTSTANNHFFTQLAQGIIKHLTQLTPKGRLYTVETPLRPIGLAGALALSQADFAQHFAGGAAPVWQWQMLSQARPVHGDAADLTTTQQLLQNILRERPWQPADAGEIRRLRMQLEKTAAPANLKRGPGGTLDVEFIVQHLQLKHAARWPQVQTPNTQEALVALSAAGLLTSEVADALGSHHRFLRRVQAALRLQSAPARHDLPEDPEQLGQIALLLGHSNPQRLREQCLEAMRQNRAIFHSLLPHSE